MKIIKQLMLVLLGTLLLTYCTEPNIDEPLSTEPIFDVDKTELRFTFEGGEDKIILTTNTTWSLTNEAEWLHVVPVKGSESVIIKVTAEKNDNAQQPREAGLKITPSEGEPIIISISQTASPKYFTVDAVDFVLAPYEDGRIVEIKSNVSWTASSDQEWITLSPSSGTGSAFVAVKAEQNSGSKRTATVTFKPNAGEAKTINIVQDAGTLKVFTGSDFEDWTVFRANVLEFMDFARQSGEGEGVDGGRALYLSGIGLTGTGSKNIFRAKTPDNFSLEGKNKITFYVKGTASPSSLVIGLYYEEGNYFYTYNLGTISTQDKVITPEVGKTPTSNGAMNFTGSIDTQGRWVKISLDISPEKLIYGYKKAVGQSLLTIRLTGGTNFDLLIDDIIIE